MTHIRAALADLIHLSARVFSALPHLPARAFAFVEDNLAFLLMLASGWHFVKVLQNYDHVAVAVAIGLLVDVGTYHSIRIAARYRYGVDRAGKHYGRRGQFVLRWTVALIMTALSLYYHLAYYEPAVLVARFVLAIPLPLLIVAVSYFRSVDRQEPVTEHGTPAAPPAASPAPVCAKDAAFALWARNPDAANEEVAVAVARSLRTVQAYRAEFAGRRNGGASVVH